jgi:nucleotide-binding universal stress UspA family protein
MVHAAPPSLALVRQTTEERSDDAATHSVPSRFLGHVGRAFDHAVAMARWYRSSVIVLHVHQITTPTYVAPYVGPEALQPVVLTDLEREQLLTALNQYVAADRAAAGVSIETILDESIDVAGSILSYADTTRADLLTLGTHGRSGFQRLVLGSVAEKVLRRARCAVLTVPPHSAEAVPQAPVSIRRILCPVDFSPSSTRALEYAASLANETGARLTVLHVVDLPADASEPPSSTLAAYHVTCFEQARARLKQAIRTSVPSTAAASDVVVAGRSHREILKLAGDEHIDLVVMGVQGRGAVDLFFFGSTTNHVVREATCPVLTLRAV